MQRSILNHGRYWKAKATRNGTALLSFFAILISIVAKVQIIPNHNIAGFHMTYISDVLFEGRLIFLYSSRGFLINGQEYAGDAKA